MKNLFFLFFAALFSSYYFYSFSQQTLTIQPGPATGKDAFINALSPNVNYATHEDFISYDWTFSSVEGLGYSLLQFDLSSLPAGVVITEAKLSLFYNPTSTSGGQTGNNACLLKKVASSWTENAVTWNSMPSSTYSGAIYLEKSSSSDQDYLGIDIIDIVTDWYAAPLTNYGLLLELIDKSPYNSLKFCSSDYPDSLKWPKLVITYYEVSNVDTCSIFQPGPVTGKDAFINELNPDVNYGTHEDFISYDWTFSSVEGLGYSLMQFDLSSLPADVVIVEAKLSLFYNPISTSAGQAGNNACLLSKVITSWNENTVTWNNLPSYTYSNAVYLEQSDYPDQDYPDIDITDFVSGWYAYPLSNNGLLLELVEKSAYNSMKFCSSDYPDSLLRPKLTVCYLNKTGISENNNTEFEVYPNPNNGILTMKLPSQEFRYSTIEILNLQGVILFREEVNNFSAETEKSIETGFLQKGLYVLRIEGNKTTGFRKLIIE
ncbi:MAG: DNRLRE domain-containing protein [Bacteroidetes bacterium]|nr:DNRLRE domain-containing protein [Bacteroidota bacterium]